MSYKDDARKSRSEKLHRIANAAHGGAERDVKKDCYARGGRTKHKGDKGDVNIIIDTAPKPPIGTPLGAGSVAPPRPPMPPAPPPMPPPGATGMPPGAMPPRPGMPAGAPPMPMRAAGGPVKMKYGAGSGEGRLEKIASAKRRGG